MASASDEQSAEVQSSYEGSAEVQSSHEESADDQSAAQQSSPEDAPWWKRHLWELEPVREALVLAVGLSILYIGYLLRAATFPALLAFSLAYLFDPILGRAKEKLSIPRTVSTLLLVLLGGGLALVAGLWLLPQVIEDGQQMAQRLPELAEGTLSWLSAHGLVAEETGKDMLEDPLRRAPAVVGGASRLFGTLTSLLGGTVVLLITGVYTLVLFVYFSIRFPRMPSIERLVPSSRRSRILELFSRFERAIGGYLRGQIIVALFTTSFFAAGFSLLGVPQAPLAACIGGALSFIPNGQVSGLLAAWLFTAIAPSSEVAGVWGFVGPGIVYGVSQTLETFVVTPLVQGRQTRIHPLVVLSALIAGASVGGLLGVFLAIPLTACGKILLEEVLVPEFERFASRS